MNLLRWFKRDEPSSPESVEAIVAAQEPEMVHDPSEDDPRPVEPSGEECDHGLAVSFYKPCPMPHDGKERKRSEWWFLYAAHASKSVQALHEEYVHRDYFWLGRNGPHPWEDSGLKRDSQFTLAFRGRYDKCREDLGAIEISYRHWSRFLDWAIEAAKEERLAEMTAQAVIRKMREEAEK